MTRLDGPADGWPPWTDDDVWALGPDAADAAWWAEATRDDDPADPGPRSFPGPSPGLRDADCCSADIG